MGLGAAFVPRGEKKYLRRLVQRRQFVLCRKAVEACLHQIWIRARQVLELYFQTSRAHNTLSLTMRSRK
jgi:hypothetical protein